MDTKAIGERSEAMVMGQFLQKGWIVLKPFGDNQRYDFVIDRGSGFETVQVKTARLKRGVLILQTCSSYGHRGRPSKDYRGQCDLFAAWSPDTKKTYLLKVDEVGTSGCSLRLEPTKNNQLTGIRLASDFEI